MKRSRMTHTIWIVITIAAFVTGMQLAGSGPDRKQAASPAMREWESAGPGVPAGEEMDGVGGNRPPPTKSNDRSRLESARRAAALRSGAPLSLADILASTRGARPLGAEQLRTLVRAAVKSADPVDRRRAFDRLLAEMQSPSLTLERALTIRNAMLREGAGREEWRLFDYAWGANSPADAVAYLDEIPEQHLTSFLGNMIPGLASTNPQAAFDLFSGLDPGVRTKIRNRLFEGLVDHDIETATGYTYELSMEEGKYDWRPMDQLAKEIFREVGLDAMQQWAERLPEGPPRGSALSSVFGHWTGADPQAAVRQVMNMEPSFDRDFALNGLTAALAHKDGEAAVLWAAEIENPGLQEIALTRAAETWLRNDPEAAIDWLPSSGLSEKIRLDIHNLLPKASGSEES